MQKEKKHQVVVVINYVAKLKEKMEK